MTRQGFETALIARGHHMDELYKVVMYAADVMLKQYEDKREDLESYETELEKANARADDLGLFDEDYLEYVMDKIDSLAYDLGSIESDIRGLMDIVELM